MAPGVRSLNCMGPGTASTSLPEALDGVSCAGFSRRCRIRRRGGPAGALEALSRSCLNCGLRISEVA
eukprot:13124390-Alexandrium_andersonii.AAC.1